ncbi:MAG: efflux RND transporter permease subunit, partial [Hyphomicrobium sp.]
FGHLPLVFVTGAGAEARNSIGIMLVSGMAIGTLFTLFILPAVYLVVAADHRQTHETSEGASRGTTATTGGVANATVSAI